MIDFEKLKQESKGKWAGIYHQLGIDVGEGKHQPCPACQGNDRFRFDDRNGNGDYYCNKCGAGDGFSLVMKCLGVDFKAALIRTQRIVGGCEKVINQKPKTDPKIALNKVWGESTFLTGNDPVSKYLHSRGLNLTPDNVRFCPECYESDSKKQMPAMVAKIQNKEGKPVSLHRTYLNGDSKADIKSSKKLMPGTEPLNGGAVRLFSPKNRLFDNDVIGVAEGIETAISCAQMYGIACWACISSTLMQTWEPPVGIKKIVIYADNDANFVGQKAAYILAQKLYNMGLIVSVEMPDKIGDWNDILARKDSI